MNLVDIFLMPDIWTEMANWLEIKDLLTLANVCKAFHELSDTKETWKSVICRILHKEVVTLQPEIERKYEGNWKLFARTIPTKPILLTLGNDVQRLETNLNPFNWTVFVKLQKDPTAPIPFLDKVIFFLHPTFQPPKQTVAKPPYQLVRRGWGTFNVRVELHFGEILSNVVVKLEHELSFEEGGSRNIFSVDPLSGTAIKVKVHKHQKDKEKKENSE